MFNNSMFSNRLQQTLNARIQLIENLLLIYSYSELVHLRVETYQRDNENIYQKEMMLLESYQQIFKADDKFTKLFCSLVGKIFSRLNKNFKGESACRGVSNKIKTVYFDFLSFFRLTNEYQIVRYLQKIEMDSVSQNQLFFLLTNTLIKYLKLKTDTIILRLREKSKKEQLDFYQEKSIQLVEIEKYRNARKKQGPCRNGMINYGKYRSIGSSLTSRRYKSEQLPKLEVTPYKKASCTLRKSDQKTSQRQTLDVKEACSIGWKFGIKRFKEIYAQQWQTYYKMLTPIVEELEELRLKSRKIPASEKKQWASSYYSDLYRQNLQRNQNILKKIRRISEISPKRKSVHSITRL